MNTAPDYYLLQDGHYARAIFGPAGRSTCYRRAQAILEDYDPQSGQGVQSISDIGLTVMRADRWATLRADQERRQREDAREAAARERAVLAEIRRAGSLSREEAIEEYRQLLARQRGLTDDDRARLLQDASDGGVPYCCRLWCDGEHAVRSNLLAVISGHKLRFFSPHSYGLP